MLNAPPPSRTGRSKYMHTLTAWVPPVAWAVLIFILSSLPGSTIPSPFFSADKVFHLVAYAVLGYLVVRLLGRYLGARYFLVLLACCVCFLYGISDEYHQKFVPGRSSSITDIAADVLGSFLGVVIYMRKR